MPRFLRDEALRREPWTEAPPMELRSSHGAMEKKIVEDLLI